MASRINSSVRLEERLRMRRKRTSGEQAAGVKEAIEEQELGAAHFEVSDSDDEEEREEVEKEREEDPGPEVAMAVADIVDRLEQIDDEMQMLSQSRRRKVNRRAPSSDVVAEAAPITLNPQTPQDGHRSDSNPSSRPSSASHRRKVRNRSGSRDNLNRENS